MDDFLRKSASLKLFVGWLKAFKNLEAYTENSVIQQNQLFTGMLEGNSEEVGTEFTVARVFKCSESYGSMVSRSMMHPAHSAGSMTIAESFY